MPPVDSPDRAAAPLRVWLEPGYDRGRFGAWLLDLPGAFGWADSREAAISQAASVAGWFRDWAATHGEGRNSLPPISGREVVEEVATEVVDGYERNATFAADHRPLLKAELDAAVHRLEFAREDLLVLGERIRAYESINGPLEPTSGADAIRTDGSAPSESDGPADRPPGRTAEDVLRHIADVEVWLGSRLDPTARYADAKSDLDVQTHLARSRRWAVDNLRRLADAQAADRTDSKGETWTLPKVVRRYVYHSIDHLRELDRRLARAERRVDRLEVRTGRLRNPMPLVRLLRSVGWDHRAEPERLARGLEGTAATAEAWDGDRLVAFARLVSDRAMTAVLTMVVVDPAWQGLGLASRIVHLLVDDHPELTFHLVAAPGVAGLYEQLGFTSEPNAMVRRRRI